MISQKARKYVFSKEYLVYYRQYKETLNKLNITEDTKDWRLKHIRGLLFYLEENKISFKDLKPENVYDYMLTLKDYSERTKEHRAVCIRLFLNYLFEKKIIFFTGKQTFPKIKCYKYSTIIEYYNDEEIKKLVNNINTTSNNGKRDLAIILLFVHYGIRVRDIFNLKLENINWQENTIRFIQSKNNTLITFSMNEDVRYALLDYLKNVKPNSNLPYVFLKNKDKRYSDANIYHIVSNNMNSCGINTKNKKHGPHSLRHSLGKSLLNQKHSIEEISSVLGHTNIDDTEPYLHIDINKLKELSLEVPIWKN